MPNITGSIATGLGTFLIGNAEAGRLKGEVPNLPRPSEVVPQQTRQGQYDQWTRTVNSYVRGNAVSRQGMSEEERQFARDVVPYLQQYGTKDANGQYTINWDQFMQSGSAPSSAYQTVANPSMGDLYQTGQQDINRALTAAQEDQQRALNLGQEASDRFRQIGEETTALMGSTQQGYDQIARQLDQDRAIVSQIPGLVDANGQIANANLQAFQQAATRDLNLFISQGMSSIDAAKSEAMGTLATGYAREAANAANTALMNYRQQTAQIESDPNIPPEARAQLRGQLGFQAATQAQQAVAPVREAFRKLENDTLTNFAQISTNFRSVATQSIAAQQSSFGSQRASLSGQTSTNYASAVQAAGQIGTQLSNIQASAEASRAANLGTLASLRAQAETNGDTILANLLPLQSTPYVGYMGLENAMFSLNQDLLNADFAAAQQEFQNQAVISSVRLGTLQASAGGINEWMQAHAMAPPSQSSTGSIWGGGLSALGAMGSAAMMGPLAFI